MKDKTMTTRVFKIIPTNCWGEVCGNTIFTIDVKTAAISFFDGDDVSVADAEFKACGVVFSTALKDLSVEKE
jgi:hypothetical protein